MPSIHGAPHDENVGKGALKRPFEVRVGGSRHGSFKDLRDAIASAKIAKRESPNAVVGVADAATGQFVVIDE